MHLAQARQNLAIPRIDLIVDMEVKRRIDEAHKNKTVCKVNDFQDILGEEAFKKRLEANINQWLKDIRKITQLDHNVSTGTTSQEIAFWGQMETSLNLVLDQIQSEEV